MRESFHWHLLRSVGLVATFVLPMSACQCSAPPDPGDPDPPYSSAHSSPTTKDGSAPEFAAVPSKGETVSRADAYAHETIVPNTPVKAEAAPTMQELVRRLRNSMVRSGALKAEAEPLSVNARAPARSHAKMEVEPEDSVPNSDNLDSAMAVQLQRELNAQGWQSEPQPDGSLVYRAPRPESKVGQPTEVLDQGLRSPAEELEYALERQGWQPARGDDGSLIIEPWTQD